MEVKIVFYKSSSKFYDTVCSLCEAFDGYKTEQAKNTLILEIAELKDKRETFEYILGYIRNWKKTECFIDNKSCDISKLNFLFDIFNCEKFCKKCIVNNEFCFEDAGWGCKRLASISLRRESYYSYRSDAYWYDFGHFENDDWILDKDRLLSQLQSEATAKHIEICEYYDFKRIENTVQSLPDKISITDEECDWEYKYRDAPFGMKQSEIIGIKPKEKQSSSFNSGFRISVTDFLREESDEDKEACREVPSVTFADIGGIDDIVKQVREVIELPLVAPEIFKHYHIKPHKGVLLYGPPGCGKTLIAKAIANEIKAHFITVNGPEILNKYVGQSEENLRKIFDEAKKYSPTVIYFDEFDSISTTRDADGNPLMASVVNQLLTLMDGVDETTQVCAIASTNRIDMIDEAIKRPGRFDYVVEIKNPSPDGCKSIFNIHIKDMPVASTFDVEEFVEKYLIGCSGADIAFVASEAAYNSIRRTIDITDIFNHPEKFIASMDNVIIESDFVKAATTLKESRKRAETAKFRYDFYKNQRT